VKLWPLALYRVAGDSMLPTYKPDDVLVGWRWFRPAAGQVVVVATDPRIIKRITKTSLAKVWVEGDNPVHSVDSRHFGPVDIQKLEAKIIAKL
jgi:phage repressor protein C with HTH and peptisase S24 domain